MDFKDLPSQYDHAAAQARWYPEWERRGYFHADPESDKPPYTIVIPPPNVTGALHLGHALNNTLQDILIRLKRMQGFNALWMPGTDHAGIATQAVVERRLLEEEGLSRHDLGATVDESRKNLVARIWKWKEQYEARILAQLKQLGCSCDWRRTRFTLDDTCARAVRETFFRLFRDGKIYRGKRLVNWDTFLQTAVSDDEVFHEAVKGHFWHFKYPVVKDAKWRPDEPEFVTIATTRPETMLGDTAVAVHPDPAAALDKAIAALQEKLAAAPAKEKAAIEAQLDAVRERRETMLPGLLTLRDMAARGVLLELPLTGRQIPLITDEWAKPELGTGCVKITPAHDENDYQVGQRHPEIGAVNIMNPDGTLNDNVPEKYRGLKMHTKARDTVVADLEATIVQGQPLYNPETDREDREIDLAHSDRSKTPIEPYLADQWFVEMDELAQSAMDAVTSGQVKILPERYAKGYLDWLSEKRDWPIGRQLWWGHRVPVWEVITTRGGVVDESYKAKRLQEQKDVINGLNAYLHACGIPENDYCITTIEHWKIRICSRNERLHQALNALCEFRDSYKMREVKPSEKAHTALNYVPGYKEATSAASNITMSMYSLKQDSDVLDTWFSSALWPHSTLGWPEETPELATFYPTSVLVTSRDIITLWVARMVLTGLYNMGEVPFREVYIHPKILDGYGETMSKSKGNGVDPLDVIEKFGTDALRFGIAHMTTETQDVRMPVEFECPHCHALVNQTQKNRRLPRVPCDKCGKEFSTQSAEKPADKALPRGAVVSERFELGRNFANKLWNAARFSLMNLDGYEPAPVADEELLLEDRWLLSRLSTVTETVTAALESYRFADAARALYDFAWDEFCSFYVEMTKARFSVPEQRATAQRVLAHALDVLLRLLHPMMPFLTEEVWQLLARVAPARGVPTPQAAAESVCIAAWPAGDAAIENQSYKDAQIEAQFADFQAVLGAVREIRMRQNVPGKEPLDFSVRCDREVADLLRPMQPYFTQMAKATATKLGPAATAPDMAVSVTIPRGSGAALEVHVDVSRFIDVDAERARLEKQRGELVGRIGGIEKKLANENFVKRAPAEVVEQQRASLAATREQLASVEAALAKL